MKLAGSDTIAAPATALAPAGVAVIRVSGPNCKEIIPALFKSERSPVKANRELIYGTLLDPDSGAVLDHCLCCYMEGPRSFTGEDTIEFHLHGSPLLVQQVLRVLYSKYCRPAEPGEFTRRAYVNGKLDLVQAEAVSDLISATSEQALRVAEEQLSGRFSGAIENIGEPLRNALAELEAHIDFPEEDIEPDDLSRIGAVIKNAAEEIAALLSTFRYGQTVKEGFKVLLFGKPNAGKSSLLNKFLGHERAIVTEISGTTRDILEEPASFDGYRFLFCDTAGIAATSDVVEQIGIARTKERLSWADLILCIVDATEPPSEWLTLLQQIPSSTVPVWLIVNKIDLNSSPEIPRELKNRSHFLSALTGEGFKELRTALVEEISTQKGSQSESSAVITSERQRSCLVMSDDSLKRTLKAIDEQLPLEFVSADLRIALNALEDIVGVTSTEDILGRIFSKFCIGK